MRLEPLVLAGMLAGCGPGKPAPSPNPRHPSVLDHEAAASVHEREAKDIEDRRRPHAESSGPPMECLDRPLAGTPDSGGKPLNVLRPCWTSVRSADDQQRREAEAHRRAAASHREAAAALIGAERRHCRGLGEYELSESPFWHKQDISTATKVVKNGRLQGATVRFRSVPGLSAEWLRRAAGCHHARARVLGHPPTFMTYCPLALPDVRIEVEARDDGVELTITSTRDEIAAAVWGRAAELLEPPRQKR